MSVDLVEVIKEHIKRGAPHYVSDKELVLKLCGKLGINTIEQFYDMLFNALRCGCSKNFWEDIHSKCLDSDGSYIAYGKDEIAKALGKNPDELTCEDICYNCGSCAHINRIDYSICKYLADKVEEKGIKFDEDESGNRGAENTAV